MVSSLALYKHLRQMFRDRQTGEIFWDANKWLCKFRRHSDVVMAERASMNKAGCPVERIIVSIRFIRMR